MIENTQNRIWEVMPMTGGQFQGTFGIYVDEFWLAHLCQMELSIHSRENLKKVRPYQNRREGL